MEWYLVQFIMSLITLRVPFDDDYIQLIETKSSGCLIAIYLP